MSKEKAQIISLSSLMTEKIGGEVDEREESDKDLKLAIAGESRKEDFFELDTAKERELEKLKAEEDTSSELDDDNIDDTPETPAAPIIMEDNNSTIDNSDTDTESSDFYRKSLRSMFGDSISHIIEEDEEGNEVEISIDEVKITGDFFNQIIKSKIEEIKEEAQKDKISLKGVSSFARDLVEIDRNGGDASELLRAKEAYSDPLDNLDLTTEQGQVQAVYLRMMAGGQDEDTTRRLINSYKSEGILEEKANSAEAELRQALQAQVENAKQASKQKAEERKSLMKEYKKDIKEELSRYQLNDTFKNKVVALATKEDENGRFELDQVYYKHRENPKDAADLALFLLDKQEYINQVTNEATEKTKLNSARKLRVVAGGGSPTLADNGVKDRSSKGTISLSSLNT